jgi:hypothetical protein
MFLYCWIGNNKIISDFFFLVLLRLTTIPHKHIDIFFVV